MGKIIVNKVELKNFFSYGNQWQTVDLNEGVNIVLGHDKDKERSNGAGKTSFLEAIPFALFGMTSKGVAQNKIINWVNNKQCEVKLHFDKDGHSYVLHRGIKPGILELIKDGVPVPKLSDKRVFQTELEQDLIGMDFKAAEALLFQNANNMVSIFNTPKAEKRRFIEKFFNLEIYSKMNEQTNGKLSNVVKKLSEIDMEIGFKKRRIDELDDKIKSMAIPDIESYKEKVDVAIKELDVFVEKNNKSLVDVKGLEKEVTSLREQLVGLKTTNKEKSKEKGQINDKFSKLIGEKDLLKKRIDNIGDLSGQKDKLERVKQAIEKFGDLDRTKVLKEIEKLREKESKEKQLLTECNTYIRQYKNEIASIENMETTEETICPTCFQEVDHEHIKHHIESQISELKRELADKGEQVSNIEQTLSDTKTKIKHKEDELSKIDSNIDKKRQLENALVKLEGVGEKQKEIDDNNKRIKEIDDVLCPELESEIKRLSMEILDIEENMSMIEDNIKEKEDKISFVKELTYTKSTLENNISSEQKVYDNMKEIYDKSIKEHEDNKKTREDLTEELSNYEIDIKKLNKMKDHLEYVKETLKDENVKQYAISNIIPFLQQQTNHYLAETGHNYYVELDSWLDGTIKGYGVGDCDFGNMSGGEGKSIDLALKFAMMDVARRQAGSYIDVLVLDELLDSSIDSHGIEKTFDIIRIKQREDNLKVFVVSHREEVADFGVDNTYKVTKENGLSSVERIE